MFGTVVVALILLTIVTLIIRSMVKDKKRGKSVICGGECSHCGHTCPHRMSQVSARQNGAVSQKLTQP